MPAPSRDSLRQAGAFLADQRLKHQWKREELAHRLGYSVRDVQRIEAGQQVIPAEDFRLWATVLHLHPMVFTPILARYYGHSFSIH